MKKCQRECVLSLYLLSTNVKSYFPTRRFILNFARITQDLKTRLMANKHTGGALQTSLNNHAGVAVLTQAMHLNRITV